MGTKYVVTIGEMKKDFPDYDSAMEWFKRNHQPGWVWNLNKYQDGQIVY